MFRIDTHVHSSEGSRCGKIPATEVVHLYKNAGYDGIVLTNHFGHPFFESEIYSSYPTWEEKVDYIYSIYETAKSEGDKIGLKVFFGIELKNYESHNDYLVYGVTPEFLKREKLFDKPLPEIKKILSENEMIIIQAHPYRDICFLAPSEFLDGIEVFNGHFSQNSHNNLAAVAGEKMGKLVTSGSDFHQYPDLGNGGIIFESAPLTDNFAEALKTIPYKLITSQPQKLCVTAINIKEKGLLKTRFLLRKLEKNNSDLIIINYFGDEKKTTSLKRILNKRRVIAFFNGRMVFGTECKIGRIPIYLSKDSAIKNCFSDPALLICEKITQEEAENFKQHGISLIVAAKSGCKSPYYTSSFVFCGFDNNFDKTEGYRLEISGSDTYIDELYNL